MIASQLIYNLQNMIKKYGDLPVYSNGEIYNDDESECSNIIYCQETDDNLLDEQLPERLFIKV